MLSYYPCLRKIIHKDSLLYKTTRDQYRGNTPEGRRASTLGGILNELYDYRMWIEMMDNLNKWICQYPEYENNKSFRENIKTDILNFYSEIEIFHRLKEKGINPKLNPKINSSSRNNLDFAIHLGSDQFFIEVFTPPISEDLDEKEEEGYVCFGDMERGIGSKNKEPYSRVETLILEEIAKHHIDLSSESVDAPIILVMNNSYAKEEVPGIQNPFGSLELPAFICGVLFYDQNGNSNFFGNPKSELDEAVPQFFNSLF
jgi:hypothetical protein